MDIRAKSSPFIIKNILAPSQLACSEFWHLSSDIYVKKKPSLEMDAWKWMESWKCPPIEKKPSQKLWNMDRLFYGNWCQIGFLDKIPSIKKEIPWACHPNKKEPSMNCMPAQLGNLDPSLNFECSIHPWTLHPTHDAPTYYGCTIQTKKSPL